MLKGRFNHHLVTAKGLIYAIGGEGPFSEHDDIEVGCVGVGIFRSVKDIFHQIYDPSMDEWSPSVTSGKVFVQWRQVFRMKFS